MTDIQEPQTETPEPRETYPDWDSPEGRMAVALDLSCKIMDRLHEEIAVDGYSLYKFQQLVHVIAGLPPEKLTAYVRDIQADILKEP
jgi:hypothetical protein